MPEQHSRATIVSMAIISTGLAVLLHEGVGHGAVAWMRGAIPTQLTSNHLSTLREDRWVDAGGTLVNLAAGTLALLAARAAGSRAKSPQRQGPVAGDPAKSPQRQRPVAGDPSNRCYFFWLFAAHNLFPGAGYFMFSGIIGFGDWQEVIRGLPHQAAWRTGMTIFGLALYALVARLLAVAIRPFCARRPMYNTVGRLPYLAACFFMCVAGAFDPLGLNLFLVSTVPGSFGGSSGMLWLDTMMPRTEPAQFLFVRRQPAWWIAAAVFVLVFIATVGRGINLPH
jgi:hypothetical protein